MNLQVEERKVLATRLGYHAYCRLVDGRHVWVLRSRYNEIIQYGDPVTGHQLLGPSGLEVTEVEFEPRHSEWEVWFIDCPELEDLRQEQLRGP